MGEAKRRGSYQERVAKAVERIQATQGVRLAQSQIEMQEHLQQLQARRIQMESQMGPMDKLYVEQKQMLHQAAEILKQKEGSKTLSEKNGVQITSVVSEISLGNTVIDVVPEEIIIEPVEGVVQSDSNIVENVAESTTETTSHFDDLAPLVGDVIH